MFYFYLLSDGLSVISEFHKFIPQWDNLENKQQIFFLRTILSFIYTSDDITVKLSDNYIANFNELCEWFNLDSEKIESDNLFYSKIKQVYDSCKSKLLELSINIEDEKKDLIFNDKQVKETNSFLHLYLNHIYGFDEELAINDNSTEIITSPVVEDYALITPDNVARTVKYQINKYLGKYFNNTVEHIPVSFDLEGLKTLYEKLKTYPQINSKTKQFTLDLAFKINRLDNNIAFLLLKRKEEELTTLSVPYIANAYFDNNQISFNLSVKEVEIRQMTKEELDKYTEKFLVPNGYYKIEQVLFSKEEAIKIYEKKYIYIVKMQFKTTMNSNCGFIIESKI
jgi:hypothetical protein